MAEPVDGSGEWTGGCGAGFVDEEDAVVGELAVEVVEDARRGWGDGEYVDEVSGIAVVGVDRCAGFFCDGADIADFGEGEEEHGVGGRVVDAEMRRELGGCHGKKAAVAVEVHLDVDIVVPGDESAVSDGAEESAGAEPVVDGVATADSIDMPKDIEHGEL